MATATVPFRHRLLVEAMNFTADHEARCTCGKNFERVGDGLVHVKLARRWRYLGVEEHYGDRYHMWEHALTSRRYAWALERYQKETLS